MMNETELKKLKVTELKEKLHELGLSTAGKKDELVARLVEHATTVGGSGAGVTTTDVDDLAPPEEVPTWIAE